MSLMEAAAGAKLLDDIFSEEWEDFFAPPEDVYWKNNEKPVDIKTFIQEGDFLGLRGRIYPMIEYCFENIEKDSMRESILLLGKGSGKTTVLQIYMIYGIYQLLLMKDPCDYFELLPGTPITELLVSVSEKQAKAVGFAGIKARLDRSPWFKNRYEALTTEIRFANDINLYCGHSGSTSWLGFNTVRGAMDEVEWMRDSNNHSVSRDLYRALKGSLVTRFPDKYKLLLISSVKEESSFLNSEVKNIKLAGNKIELPEKLIIPVSNSVFENTHRCRVELVDMLANLEPEAYETDNSFALKSPTWKINPKTKLDDYLDDFYRDEPGSLRDYASVPVHSLTPFFKDSSLIDRMAKREGKVCPIDPVTLTISPDFKPNLAFKYFFAGDLSVSGDDTGISMVHYDWFRDLVHLDFSFNIEAKRGERVDYEPIRQLIYNLIKRGFLIKTVAFDQFQSNDSINKIRSRGIYAIQVQYADSFVGCTQLHELITSGRFEYDDFNERFMLEAQELQIVNSKRIDHLMNGGRVNSKDVWDSAVNATWVCLNDFYENGSLAKDNQVASNVASKLVEKRGKREEDPFSIGWIL